MLPVLGLLLPQLCLTFISSIPCSLHLDVHLPFQLHPGLEDA